MVQPDEVLAHRLSSGGAGGADVDLQAAGVEGEGGGQVAALHGLHRTLGPLERLQGTQTHELTILRNKDVTSDFAVRGQNCCEMTAGHAPTARSIQT